MVSIIIPVYNVEKYIQRCLESLVNQTFDDYELIIVNDGSPDNSEKIIKKYEKKYKNIIRYYKKENGGLSDARNYGLSKAKGEYVIFVDSDDYVENTFVKKLYDKAIENDSDITICGVLDEIEKSGNQVIYKNYIPKKGVSIDEDKKQLLNRFAAWNKMYKIDLFGDLKFEKGKIYEDLRLIPKLYLKANRISYVDEPLYHYIIRDGSIMTSSGIQKNLDIISAFDDVIAYFKKQNKYKEFKDEIEFLAIDHLLIATGVRIAKMSTYKELSKNLKYGTEFIKKNFPKYMNNKYKNTLSRNKKIIMFLLRFKQYHLLKALISIKDGKR